MISIMNQGKVRLDKDGLRSYLNIIEDKMASPCLKSEIIRPGPQESEYNGTPRARYFGKENTKKKKNEDEIAHEVCILIFNGNGL